MTSLKNVQVIGQKLSAIKVQIGLNEMVIQTIGQDQFAANFSLNGGVRQGRSHVIGFVSSLSPANVPCSSHRVCVCVEVTKFTEKLLKV